ncbi:hypothetical protein, partial [Micromonospora globosa]|uniref:hypothetical protein n=1 Tax=Micromonospora globosa TaxID=47863 RepID=UPI001E497869
MRSTTKPFFAADAPHLRTTQRYVSLTWTFSPQLVLQPGMLTLAELGLGVVCERVQPPSIMGGCVD